MPVYDTCQVHVSYIGGVWVNFVRDRTDAHVHVLMTSEGTGSGGRQITITFDGLGAQSGVRDSLTALTPQGATDDEVRRELMRVLSVGAGASPGARGARDPWNLWVSSIRALMFSNGDDNYRNMNIFGNVNARRLSEAWKVRLSASVPAG